MLRFMKFASVTKKITLAILGSFLMLFLLVHAGINLCMLRADGGEWFRAAAHFMGTNYIVKVFEVVLFAALILHILLGIFIQWQNCKARPVRYKVPNKSATAPGSKFMIYTGILVAIFLVLHLMNFYFVKMNLVEGKYLVKVEDVQKADPAYVQEHMDRVLELFQSEDPAANNPFKEEASGITKAELAEVFGPDFTAYEPDFYSMAKDLFNNPVYLTLYLLLILALGVHLLHAFPSALHTLGLNGPCYDRPIKCIGAIYALIVVLMFWAVAIGLNILY